MKITIIGGSKGTGAALAALARDTGHEVTVLSRSGSAPAGVRSLTGDATDRATAGEAVAGADAVVVTVGGAKGSRRHRTEVTRAVVDAMGTHGVRRLLVQSSLGSGDSATQLPGVLGFVTKVLLAAPLADHNEQESVVMGSGLDWTIVRPTGLTNKPAEGAWQALQVGEPGRLKGTITRADLAAFMLEALEDVAAISTAYGVSGR